MNKIFFNSVNGQIMKILIGTNNEGKLKEFKKALSKIGFKVVSPKELGIFFDPKETGETFEENARAKAIAWAKKTQLPTLVDDSGLIIDFLNGLPGVKSKRFFSGSDQDRNKKILELMENMEKEKRKARYICSLVFVDLKKNIEIVTNGICEGNIDVRQTGKNGFGYDSIFIPKGFKKSFGVLDGQIKAKLSHRAKALCKMSSFLKECKL